jgi:hypothetical protein
MILSTLMVMLLFPSVSQLHENTHSVTVQYYFTGLKCNITKILLFQIFRL